MIVSSSHRLRPAAASRASTATATIAASATGTVAGARHHRSISSHACLPVRPPAISSIVLPGCRRSDRLLAVLGLALALAASSGWGMADFLAGHTARGLSTLRVAVWSKAAGFCGIVIVALAAGALPSAAQVPWAIAGGAVGVAALLCLYRALALGPMSLVAPLSACCAVVPVAVAFALGEFPGPRTSAGLALAFAGAVVVSRPPADREAPGAALTREALIVSLAAALLIGIALTCLQQAAQAEGGSALGIAVLQTTVTFGLLVVIAAVRRPGGPPAGRDGLAVAGVGVLDVGANVLFAAASARANPAAVAVLGSLYPVFTVLLARTLLSERLSGSQAAGVGCTLAGVGLIGLGG